jgi:hypothetical protein
MKFKGDFDVGYNVQIAVDSKHHLISKFEVTDHPTDNGLIVSVASKARGVLGTKIIEAVLDKGYWNKRDRVDCLE